jgi:hypothetical protein
MRMSEHYFEATDFHWLTRFDPDDGEPYGTLCDCDIGDDHTGADMWRAEQQALADEQNDAVAHSHEQ